MQETLGRRDAQPEPGRVPAGTAALQSRGAPGPSPHLPAVLWGCFPTLPGSMLAVDLEAAFLDVIWGLMYGRSARELPGWWRVTLLGVGSSPIFRVYLESGMWLGHLVCAVHWRKDDIPIESWQTFLE